MRPLFPGVRIWKPEPFLPEVHTEVTGEKKTKLKTLAAQLLSSEQFPFKTAVNIRSCSTGELTQCSSCYFRPTASRCTKSASGTGGRADLWDRAPENKFYMCMAVVVNLANTLENTS